MRLEQAKSRRRSTGRNLALLTVPKSTAIQILKARLECLLPKNIVDDWLERHLVVNLPKDTFVFKKGTQADLIYFVRAGLVDVLSRDSQGRRLIVEMAAPGDLLGFMDFADSRGESHQLFDARARTQCEIGIITRERIELALDQLSSSDLVSIAERINDWWSEKIKYWVTFSVLHARERLELVLTRLAEKLGVEDAYGKLIPVEFSHEDLGLMTASPRPMVSRLLADLVAEGRLSRRDRRYVLHKTAKVSGPTNSLNVNGFVTDDDPMHNLDTA
jgi:CRP-like cAMP-binding protein